MSTFSLVANRGMYQEAAMNNQAVIVPASDMQVASFGEGKSCIGTEWSGTFIVITILAPHGAIMGHLIRHHTKDGSMVWDIKEYMDRFIPIIKKWRKSSPKPSRYSVVCAAFLTHQDFQLSEQMMLISKRLRNIGLEMDIEQIHYVVDSHPGGHRNCGTAFVDSRISDKVWVLVENVRVKAIMQKKYPVRRKGSDDDCDCCIVM